MYLPTRVCVGVCACDVCRCVQEFDKGIALMTSEIDSVRQTSLQVSSELEQKKASLKQVNSRLLRAQRITNLLEVNNQLRQQLKQAREKNTAKAKPFIERLHQQEHDLRFVITTQHTSPITHRCVYVDTWRTGVPSWRSGLKRREVPAG